MANIVFNPGRFLEAGQHIQDGSPNRLPRADITVPTPQKQHEAYLLAVVEPEIRNHLQNELGIMVTHCSPHPLGVGLFAVRSTLIRDTLVATFGFHYNGGNVVRFVNHDRGANWRAAHADIVGWIMFLGYPLDFRSTSYISRVVGLFGKLDFWQEVDAIPGRVMLRAFFDDVDLVPRRIVIKQIPNNGGQGESWTFGVFVVNNDFVDQQPQDEDLPQQADNQQGTGQSGMSSNGGSENMQVMMLAEHKMSRFYITPEMQGKIDEFVLRKNLLDNMHNRTPVPRPIQPATPFRQLIYPKRKAAPACSALPLKRPILGGTSGWAEKESLSVILTSEESHVLSPIPLAILPPKELLLLPTPPVGGNSPLMDIQHAESSEPPDMSVQPSSPTFPFSGVLVVPKAPVKKKDGKTVLFDPERRQSSRLKASAHDFVRLDPRMGIGKPRGKSARKLKELAGIAKLPTDSVLSVSDFHPDLYSESESFTDSTPSEGSIPFLQKMGTEMCGLHLEDVAESKLRGKKLSKLPRPSKDNV
uniref:DUF7597 domain-containing protein n=1 Tax=Oryza punctata TaxID=4537 RepID=A0A0E0KMY4_ORYPU